MFLNSQFGCWLLAPFLLTIAASGNTEHTIQEFVEKARQAPAREARGFLRQAVRILQATKDLDGQEQEAAWRMLAEVLPQKAQTQVEVLEVLGNMENRTVSRQILFRRYLEQWTFSGPRGLVVVFDCPRGQEPRLRQVALR